MIKADTVAVLGASEKKQRYSNRAVAMLLEHGHNVVPVHPRKPKIYGLESVANLNEAVENHGPIGTLTIYVGEDRSNQMIDHILASSPRRIIMNPGAENEQLEQQAKDRGIEVINACTLVMLSTGQF